MAGKLAYDQKLSASYAAVYHGMLLLEQTNVWYEQRKYAIHKCQKVQLSIYMWNVHVSYFMTPINIACSMFSYSYWFKQLFQCMHVEALMESQTLFPDKQKKKKNNNECIIHNGNEWWTKFVAMIHSLIISSMYVDCRLWNVHDALQCIAAMPESGSSTNSAL